LRQKTEWYSDIPRAWDSFWRPAWFVSETSVCKDANYNSGLSDHRDKICDKY